MAPKSFSKFVEEREAEDKARIPYLNSLEDELGIDPRDLEKDPQMASFYSLGGDTKNIGLYRIVKIMRDENGEPTHAVVKTMEDASFKSRTYRGDGDGMKRVDGEGEEKTIVVPIEELDKLMSQDLQPPPGGPA